MTEQEAINDLKMSLRMWGRKPQKESYEMAIHRIQVENGWIIERSCKNENLQGIPLRWNGN